MQRALARLRLLRPLPIPMEPVSRPGHQAPSTAASHRHAAFARHASIAVQSRAVPPLWAAGGHPIAKMPCMVHLA
ncbi:hypothetical protein G6O67_001116 [Ophiocordyceps sinensis]|uniref:Uncharacterized protein n=1 Tax=Ophiocordyceps sinensis TaxID=72228 RepID=A0A8H4PWS5_9HYPO|nr:hypothetical protein G6O67_001116 [Ophiocordyceps sinensis]